MKQKYISPVIEITNFTTEDIITASSGSLITHSSLIMGSSLVDADSDVQMGDRVISVD